MDVAADGEVADDFDFPWVEEVDHVLDDDVGDVFVEDLFVAEAVDVEL